MNPELLAIIDQQEFLQFSDLVRLLGTSRVTLTKLLKEQRVPIIRFSSESYKIHKMEVKKFLQSIEEPYDPGRLRSNRGRKMVEGKWKKHKQEGV